MAIVGPKVCLGLVISLTGRLIQNLNEKAKRQIEESKNFRLLDALHHFTSGIKAFATEQMYKGLDELRQACGGAGFLMSSGIAQQWTDASPFPTFEGVNVLMYQQSARYLFKQLKRLEKEQMTIGFFTYMNYLRKLVASRCTAVDVQEFIVFENLTQTLATRASYYILETAKLMKNKDLTEK